MKNESYELLRAVSRSFYISIRALPQKLREPVALAYLLARTSDTIADTEAIDPKRRLELLDRFAAAVSGGIAPEEFRAELASAQRAEAAPAGTTEGEQQLLGVAQRFLGRLVESPADDRAEIRALLALIIRAQRLDLTRWSSGIRALATADELREYTYLVAGCVGEFWTRICFRKLSSFTAREQSEMMELGRKYGSGLQLVNILRDAGEDLRAGRCYFPEEELRAAGLSAEQLAQGPPGFLPIYERWIAEARAGLDAGLEYCIAIDPPRVRTATVLPALIGVRTLELLQNRGLDALSERVKVPRAEVRQIIASAAITLANRTRLRSTRARL